MCVKTGTLPVQGCHGLGNHLENIFSGLKKAGTCDLSETTSRRLCDFNPCILVDSPTVICWRSPFIILGVSVLFCHFYSFFDGNLVS